MRERGRRKAVARVLGAAAVLAGLTGCSGDDDSTEGTLGVIEGGSTTAAPAVPGSGPVTGDTGAPGATGAGFVSIDVQVAADGITETISLDRATVAAASLNPVDLNATCTPLDGGDAAAGVVVSVVDLGRIAGNQLVSAVLRYADPAPGEHEMTLEVGGADQVATTYGGTVTVGDDGMSGSFEGADSGGNAVTGAFVCAAEPVAPPPAATVPPDVGEEVPEATG